jgi:hypothetical protein
VITAKLGEIFTSVEVLTEVMKQKLPVKAAYRLSRIADEINGEMKKMDEFRIKLIESLGEKGEDGNSKVKEENMPEFREKYAELMSTEVQLNIKPIPISWLGDFDIEPGKMISISRFIDETDAELNPA